MVSSASPPAADLPEGAVPVPHDGAGRPHPWFEWRYLAAGTGWGALVGIVTGVGLALWVVIDAVVVDGAGAAALGLLAMGTFVGAMWGGLLGFVAGVPAGLAAALVLPHLRGWARWWTALLVPSAMALMIASLLLAWDRSRGISTDVLGFEAGALLALVPAVALGWLMARTSESLRRTRRVG